MQAPQFFEMADGYAVLRPSGMLTLEVVVDMVTDAICHARAVGESRLLVVVGTAVTGMKPPQLTRRYEFIREWARASGGMVRVAIVTTLDMIDPGRFGITVAANAGMLGNVFEEEEAAVTWLVG